MELVEEPLEEAAAAAAAARTCGKNSCLISVLLIIIIARTTGWLLLDKQCPESSQGGHNNGNGSLTLHPEKGPSIVLDAVLLVIASRADGGADGHDDGQTQKDSQADLCRGGEHGPLEHNDGEGDDHQVRDYVQDGDQDGEAVGFGLVDCVGEAFHFIHEIQG